MKFLRVFPKGCEEKEEGKGIGGGEKTLKEEIKAHCNHPGDR